MSGLRARRWVVAGVSAVAGVALTIGAVLCVRRCLRRLDQKAAARSAYPILDGIYAFKNRHGLWPQTIDDALDEHPELRPLWQQLSTADGWEYSWFEDGSFELGVIQPLWALAGMKTRLAYVVARRDGGPVVNAPEFAGYAPRARPRGAHEAPDAAVNELSRRMEREPDRLVHYRWQISLLVEQKRLLEAKRACESCIENCRRELWPHLALLDIDERLGLPGASLGRVKGWLTQYGRFEDHLLYFYFLRDRGEVTPALEASREAADHPIGPLEGAFFRTYREEVYLLDVASFAYSHDQHETVIKLLADKQQVDSYLPEEGYLLRAGSFLALGEVGRARWNGQKAMMTRRDPLQRRLPALMAAIEAGDTSYRTNAAVPNGITFELYEEPM